MKLLKLINKIKAYGLFGLMRLVGDLTLTKLFYRQCRILRRPYYIRNFGKIVFGKNLTTGVALRIDVVKPEGLLVIGENVQLNDYCHIGVASYVEIGNGTLIASKVFITDHQHGNISGSCNESSPLTLPISRPLSVKDVIIGENVWIGENVTILPGVNIGNGCIIGAGSVVTRNLPSYIIAAGCPAKIIKHYDFSMNKWVMGDFDAIN